MRFTARMMCFDSNVQLHSLWFYLALHVFFVLCPECKEMNLRMYTPEEVEGEINRKLADYRFLTPFTVENVETELASILSLSPEELENYKTRMALSESEGGTTSGGTPSASPGRAGPTKKGKKRKKGKGSKYCKRFDMTARIVHLSAQNVYALHESTDCTARIDCFQSRGQLIPTNQVWESMEPNQRSLLMNSGGGMMA